VRIALDLTGLPRVGGARSSALLWSEKVARAGSDHEFLVFASEQLTAFEGMDNVRLVARILPNRGLVRAWAQACIPGIVGRHGIEVYHAMKNIGLLGIRCPTVITINDLTHVTLAHLDPPIDRFFWAKVQPVLLRRASAIIAISNATKDMLVRHYGLPDQRVAVIHPPMNELYGRTRPREEREALLRRYGLAGGYFLYVGSLGVHKNVATALDAHVPVWERHGIPLVLVTGAEHTRVDTGLTQDLCAISGDGRVRHLGFVPEDDMPLLYQGATALVNPSLSEGFGLVALEAMACGTPVIASGIPSLCEVVQSAGLFVDDPRSAAGFTEAMERLVLDVSLRDELSLSAADRAAHFAQMDTAEQTMSVYRRVLAPRAP